MPDLPVEGREKVRGQSFWILDQYLLSGDTENSFFEIAIKLLKIGEKLILWDIFMFRASFEETGIFKNIGTILGDSERKPQKTRNFQFFAKNRKIV